MVNIPYPQPPVINDPFAERVHRKARLAAGFRLFGRFGFEEGVAGHITARDPVEPETFWVNPLGMPFSHIRVSDLLRVNHDDAVYDEANERFVVAPVAKVVGLTVRVVGFAAEGIAFPVAGPGSGTLLGVGGVAEVHLKAPLLLLAEFKVLMQAFPHRSVAPLLGKTSQLRLEAKSIHSCWSVDSASPVTSVQPDAGSLEESKSWMLVKVK